jgi:hypothetical protein
MTAPRGHHLLPQTYQRGFANAKNQVLVVERATGQGHVVNIRDAFKRRDWNAVKDQDGNLDHTAEQLLADYVDAPASPGLQQLRNGDLDLEPADRIGVGVFIAAQMGRTQYMRESFGEFEAGVLRQTLALAAQHYSDERWEEITGEIPSAEIRDRIARGEGFEISVDKAELFVVQEVAHDLGPMVASMSWLRVDFDEPCLLSSSHPVVMLAERPPPRMMGLGLGTADATYVPLSPSRALAVRPTLGADRAFTGSPSLARKLNYQVLTASLSDQLLLCPDVATHPLPVVRTQAGFPRELTQ